MAAWGFRLVALFVVAGIVFYALRSYHHRRMAEIETAELELDGFVKITLAAITFAWQCPKCGTPLLTREAVIVHQESSSACALVREDGAEGAGVEYRATVEDRTPGDTWPALGAEDDAPELEGAR